MYNVLHLLLFLLLLLLALQSVFPKKKKFFYILSCVIIVFFSAFRDINSTQDTQNYYNYFLFIKNLGFKELFTTLTWEPGYVLLNKFISFFGTSDFYFLFIMTILLEVPIFIIINKYTKSNCLALIIYCSLGYFYHSINLYRQFFALIIVYYALKYVYRREFFKYCLCILLAMMFHRTAIVMFPIYFCYKFKIKLEFIIGCFLISIILIPSGDILLSIMNHFARIEENASFAGGITLFILLWLFVLYLFNRRKKSDEKFNLMLILLIVSATIQSVSFTFSNFSRITQYFMFSLVFLIPNIYQNIRIKRKYFAEYVIILLLFIMLFISGLNDYSFSFR